MSSRLLKKQLASLQQESVKDQAPAAKGHKAKAIKKRSLKRKQQQQKEQKAAAAKDPTAVYARNLQYFEATQTAQAATLDVMTKVSTYAIVLSWQAVSLLHLLRACTLRQPLLCCS